MHSERHRHLWWRCHWARSCELVWGSELNLEHLGISNP